MQGRASAGVGSALWALSHDGHGQRAVKVGAWNGGMSGVGAYAEDEEEPEGIVAPLPPLRVGQLAHCRGQRSRPGPHAAAGPGAVASTSCSLIYLQICPNWIWHGRGRR